MVFRVLSNLLCCRGKSEPRSKQYKKNKKKENGVEVDAKHQDGEHSIESLALQEHDEVDRSNETVVENSRSPALKCTSLLFDDMVEDFTSTSSQVTPRPVNAADVLNVAIEELESAVTRNEELQHDITMNISNCYNEVLTDTNKLLQQLEESDGSITECSTLMEEDNPTLVSMEHPDDRSSPVISNNSCIHLNDIDCNINDCSMTKFSSDRLPSDIADMYKCSDSTEEDSFNPRKYNNDQEDVMSDDQDLSRTSSSEPTPFDIFNDIMEGLKSAVEMNEEIYNDIAATVDTCTKEILKERDEVLRRLEEIEEAEKQRSSSVEETYPVVSMECYSDSSSHASTSSIVHENDINVDVDFQVCTTDVGRPNVYFVPCTSMAATDHHNKPHSSEQLSSDVSVTFQCSIYIKEDNLEPTVEHARDRNNLIASASSDTQLAQ